MFLLGVMTYILGAYCFASGLLNVLITTSNTKERVIGLIVMFLALCSIAFTRNALI